MCDFKVKERPEFKTHLDENHNEVNEFDNNIQKYESFDNFENFNDLEDSYLEDYENQENLLKEEKPIEEIKFKPDENQITCLQCLLVFSSVQELIEHISTNHGIEGIAFNCQFLVKESCLFSNLDFEEFKQHIIEEHFKSSNQDFRGKYFP